MGQVRFEPCHDGFDPGQVTTLIGRQLPAPAIDLTLVETLGAPQAFESGGEPVNTVESAQSLDHGIGHLGPPRFALEHGGKGERVDTLHALHQVEGAAEHSMVVTERHHLGVRHICPRQRGQNAELAAHALVGPVDRHPGRSAQDPAGLPALDDEHGVRRAPGQRLDLQWSPRFEIPGVEPGAEGIGVDELHAQRCPTASMTGFT